MRPENAVIELALPARSPRRAARLFHRLDVMDYQYKKPTRIQVLSNFSKLRNSYKIEGYEQTQKEEAFPKEIWGRANNEGTRGSGLPTAERGPRGAPWDSHREHHLLILVR